MDHADLQAEQTRDLMFRRHEIELAFERAYRDWLIYSPSYCDSTPNDWEDLADELGILSFYRSIK